ncbi:MAG: hypothetical protein ACJA2D_002495 [Pseudohongiellaceae bacterium]|jgi:hypothetical protein
MDKRYIEENEIEVKYLRNQLDPDELEEFEVYLMENPEMVDELKLDEVFIRNFAIESDIQTIVEPQVKNGSVRFWQKPGVISRNLLVHGTLALSLALFGIYTLIPVQVAGVHEFYQPRGNEVDIKPKQILVARKYTSLVSKAELHMVLDTSFLEERAYVVKVSRGKSIDSNEFSFLTSFKLSSNEDGEVLLKLGAKKFGTGFFKIALEDVKSGKSTNYFFNSGMLENDG